MYFVFRNIELLHSVTQLRTIRILTSVWQIDVSIPQYSVTVYKIDIGLCIVAWQSQYAWQRYVLSECFSSLHDGKQKKYLYFI